jgi:L-ascorbate metabolism protein UlaG (beta-lactamase superfamily)
MQGERARELFSAKGTATVMKGLASAATPNSLVMACIQSPALRPALTTITWLGHNAWSIETGGTSILLDPFLNDSPTAPVKADRVTADYILLSHGHGDHVGDTVAIAKRTGAIVITNFEVSLWLGKKGVSSDKLIGMNPGGGVERPFGHVKFTVAHHSSSLPDGSYGGVPGGFLLKLQEARLYFACDTALFLDMKLIGGGGLDLAVTRIRWDLKIRSTRSSC